MLHFLQPKLLDCVAKRLFLCPHLVEAAHLRLIVFVDYLFDGSSAGMRRFLTEKRCRCTERETGDMPDEAPTRSGARRAR